jgi:hypothetical protein
MRCFLTFFFLKKMLPRFRRLPGSCSYATLYTKKSTINLKFSALLTIPRTWESDPYAS